ncbi:4'-phosphopantetheinyl transferase family protein [Blautia sp. Sow4_E7]|uniref:4'-phosphopantetheinyl transferase family protein n=1 Tax=Blautia sp. Sow4_E7 TaxID=3438749 RepID=UPI003F90FDC6
MIKLYRININALADPLQNENLLEQVCPERRKKVIRYLQPDDRKRSLGAGIIIKKILEENGLSEGCLKYSENGKPVADHLHFSRQAGQTRGASLGSFNISHAGDYVVGVQSDREVGCDIEKAVNAPLEIASHYFCPSERKYIETAADQDKAFFTLWTLKESYMKMTGRGMSLPLDSFEIVRTDTGFALGKSPEKPGFFRTMEFENYIFSVCNESDFTLNQNEFFDIL